MNARGRSPNYPSMSLGEAIDAIKKIYAQERRSKFPRLSLASHLGYTSINGRSLAKIGAIRAFGLIDGREDALSVSHTALAILEAPDGSEDSIAAYRDAFLSPSIFARAHQEYGDARPSAQTFRWWLTQQGYVGDAADKVMQSYLDSFDLVTSIGGAHIPDSSSKEEAAFLPTRAKEAPTFTATRQATAQTAAARLDTSYQQPDFKISLGNGRWLLIEVKGGEPTQRDFIKLEKFARFQRELLEDDEWHDADTDGVDPLS